MYRKVKARVYFSDLKDWKEVIGKFHQWGNAFEEFRDSPVGNYTMAIIELEDGRIVTAPPGEVQFIE